MMYLSSLPAYRVSRYWKNMYWWPEKAVNGLHRYEGLSWLWLFTWCTTHEKGPYAMTQAQISLCIYTAYVGRCPWSISLCISPRWGTSNEYPQQMFLWRTGENYPTVITKYSSLTIPLIEPFRLGLYMVYEWFAGIFTFRWSSSNK